jgi:hypothetical protein
MKKFFFALTFLFLSTTYSISEISKYFGSGKITLDEVGVVNFIRYLEGRFYIEDLGREMHNNSPMYYAVTDDGKISYGWFCRANTRDACYENFVPFKIIEYCKEYAKKNCKIFAVGNKIVWNDINVFVDSNDFNKVIELLKKNNLYEANLIYKVSQNNYLNFVNLTIDQCRNKKSSIDYSNFRGADLDCLLPGRFEISIGDQQGDSRP